MKIILNDGHPKTEDNAVPFIFSGAICGTVVVRGNGPLTGYFKIVLEGFYPLALPLLQNADI
jgi:hypothetical protein